MAFTCGLWGSASAQAPAVRSDIDPERRVATLTWTIRRTAWLDAARMHAELACLRQARQGPISTGLGRLQLTAGPDRLTVSVTGPMTSAVVWWGDARPSAWGSALATCAKAPPSEAATPWTPRRLLEALIAPAESQPRGFTRADATLDYVGPEPPTPLAQLAQDLSPLGSASPVQPRAAVDAPFVRVEASPTDEGLILVAVRAQTAFDSTPWSAWGAPVETTTAQWGDETYHLFGVHTRPADLDATWDGLWATLRAAGADPALDAWALVLSPQKALERLASPTLWAESLRDRATRSSAASNVAMERRPGERVTSGGSSVVFAPTREPKFAVRWRWRTTAPLPHPVLDCLAPRPTAAAPFDAALFEVSTARGEAFVEVTAHGPAAGLDATLARLRAHAEAVRTAACPAFSSIAGQAGLEALLAAPPTTLATGRVTLEQALAAAATWTAASTQSSGRLSSGGVDARSSAESASAAAVSPSGDALQLVVRDLSTRNLAALELVLTALAGEAWTWSQNARCASGALCFTLVARDAPGSGAVERMRARLATLAAGPLPPTPFEALRARRKADLDLLWSEPLARLDWLAAQSARPRVSVGQDAAERWRDALDRATSADVHASARALTLTP